MKKFLLVFCLVFLFALPSMASDDYPDIFAVQQSGYEYYVVYNVVDIGTFLIWADGPFEVYKNSYGDYLFKVVNVVNGERFKLGSSSWVFTQSLEYSNIKFDSIVASNFDILDRDTGDVFFSPPMDPVAQIVQQQLPSLPQVITKAGSVVLPVALVILALILVTSLIPRLIRSYLR